MLSARGSQLERSFGFGAVRQLFEPAIGDPDRRDALLGRCGPVAQPVFDEVAGDDAVAPRQLRRPARALLADGQPRRRQGRWLICVDDVQWCDSASLRYLAYLVKRLEGLPVLVVLAVRTGEQHPDDALLAELALDPSVTVLRPAPLSPEAAGDPGPGTARRGGRLRSSRPATG